jgi:hypothetical protein
LLYKEVSGSKGALNLVLLIFKTKNILKGEALKELFDSRDKPVVLNK